MDINLNDFGYNDETVERDTPSILFCKKHDGYTPIIFKGGPSFKGKVIRWLSVEGLPMAHMISEADEKVEVTIKEFLKAIWGEKGFTGLPDTLKEALARKVGVTVTVKPVIPDTATKTIIDKVKAASILYDVNVENTALLGKNEAVVKWSDRAYQTGLVLIAGIGIDRILIGLGVLK